MALPSREEHTEGQDDDVEVVDAIPVLLDVRPVEPPRFDDRPLPAQRTTVAAVAAQAAAVATAGFAAGAVTAAVVRRARRSRSARRRPPVSPFGEIVGTKTFVVDVHFLERK